MELLRIAARVAAQVPDEPKLDLEELLKQAKAAGWTIADAVLDISDSIYRAVVLCKDMGPWEPYKGHRRSLEPCDAYVLGWWFDPDATDENVRGEFTYEPWEDEETGEKHEANVPKIQEAPAHEAAFSLAGNHADEIAARIRGVLDGSLEDRWNDAPRMDQ